MDAPEPAFDGALLELARIGDSDPAVARRNVLRVGAEALRAREASAWLADTVGSSWDCVERYRTDNADPEDSAGSLDPEVLRANRVWASEPAVLDAGIWCGGELAGALRVRRAASVPWSGSERHFAASLADRIALIWARDAEARARMVGVSQDVTERKRAEEALRQSEESYRTIFESSSDAIYIHDLETGAILDANPAACEMYGLSLEFLKEHGVPAYSGGNDPFQMPELREQIARVMAGEPQTTEWRAWHASGEEVWTEVTLRRVVIAGQERLLATGRDITARKGAEEALRRANEQLEQRVQERTAELAAANRALAEREEHFRRLIENAHDITCMLDTDGVMTYQSPSLQRLLGWEPTQLIGRSAWDFIHPDDVQRVVETVARILHEPSTSHTVEYRFRHKDGQWRVLEGTGRTLLPNSADSGLVANVRDITERREVERALREREEHFRVLIENSYDLVQVLDTQGRITYTGPSVTRILGYTPEELSSSAAADFIHPDDQPYAQRTIMEAFTNPGTARSLEYRVRHKDGSWRWLEAFGRTLSPTSPEKGLVANARDITDRKLAEEELMRQKAYFEEILDSVDAGIAVFDRTGRHEYMSPTAMPDPELRRWVIGRTIGEYARKRGLPPEVSEPRQRSLEEAISSGKPNEFEQTIQGADGSPRIMLRRLLPVLDEAGEVMRMIGYSVDITERKRAERALQQREEHFRRMIENASDMVQVVAADSRIVYTGPSVQRLLGYTPEEIADTSAFDYLHPEDAPATMAAFQQMLESPGVPVSVEYRVRHKDGSWRDFECKAMTLSSSSAEEGVVVNARDITERKRVDEALRRSEEHFRSLIENGSDIVTILDPTGRMVYQSPSMERILGYAPAEIAGTEAFTLVHPDDVPTVSAAMMAIVAAPGSTETAEYRFRHKDGNWRHLQTLGRTLRPDSAESGAVFNSRDVTERVESEAALRRATAEAERANRAKSEFLSRMSHELRTPMNGILGFAQVLDRSTLGPDQRKYVHHILQGGRHLLRLINEVLELARIEAGRLSLSLEPVQLGAVVREGFDMVRPMAEQARVEMDAAACADSEMYVHADRQRLAQVLLNLLSNAIKYNRPGGRVQVSCEVVGEDANRRLSLRVEDTGRGLPPDKMDELFTPFARLGAEQGGTEGTGLGLALSQRLAEAMGGTLALERTGPDGSVFRMDLRCAANPLERADGAAALSAGPTAISHAPATILYIEDNLTNLTLVETFLESQPGWRTISALQGRAGVDLARQHLPDLVLLDLHLPDIPGEEVLRRLRGDPRTAQIPVIVISADATKAAVDRLRAAGVEAYLTKPLDMDEFLTTVAEHVPGRG